MKGLRAPGLLLAAGALAPMGILGAQEEGSGPATSDLPEADQHVVVVVERPEDVRGVLLRYQREAAGGLEPVGEPVSVVVGRSGVGAKREGDGRSPQGVYPLGHGFGYAPEAPSGVEIPFRSMGPGTVCVDDSSSAHYNRIVDRASLSGEPDWSSAEAMRRDLAYGDDLYEWGVLVEYNPEGRPGAGSCIFLHVWRGPSSPTAGCTAMPEDALVALMRWLDPGARPVLVQGSREYLEELGLPYPLPGAREARR